MVNWKTYKILEHKNTAELYVNSPSENKTWVELLLDGFIEYKNRYDNHVNLFKMIIPELEIGEPERYIEINLDKAKMMNNDDMLTRDAWKAVPIEVIAERNRSAMLNAASASPTALAVTREGMDRVDRGEQATFIYQIEENGIKHSWIYKRN